MGCHPMRVDPYTKGPPSTSSAVIARSESARFWADWDGTVMEQRGRNRWQTFGSPKGRKWLDLARTVATGCHQLPFESHGKEGVDGSSPSEGFAKFLLISFFRRLMSRQKRGAPSTERPRAAAVFSYESAKSCC